MQFKQSFAIEKAQSVLLIRRPGIGIRVVVRSQFSRRTRRQVLLALFRATKQVFRDLEGVDLFHYDGAMPSLSATFGRPVSLHQSLAVETHAQAEGLNIRLRRLALRFTQEEFAKLSGLSRPHLSRIEHGRLTMGPRMRDRIDRGLRLAERKYEKLQKSTGDGRLPRTPGVRPDYQGSSSPSKS